MRNAFALQGAGLVGFIAVLAVLAGCQSNAARPNRINPERLRQVESLALDVRTMSDEFNVDYRASQLNLDVSVAAVTAAQVAAMNTDRETAAAGGIIGTFIGIQIARHAHQEKLQNNANKPVAPLKQRLETGEFHRRIVDAFRTRLEEQLSRRYRLAPKPAAPDAVFRVRLDVSLSQDLASMHLRAEAAMEKSPGPAVYTREIDFYDVPIGNPATTSDTDFARQWMENDGALFWSRLNAATGSLAALISADLERGTFKGAPGGRAIRYQNDRGLFYERGYLVETAPDRLLIRTLRGGLISVPGQLVENADAAASP